MPPHKKAFDNIKKIKVGGQQVYKTLEKPYYATDEQHIGKAHDYLKKFHEVYDQTMDYELAISSEIKAIAGRDYLTKKDAKKLAQKIQDLTTDTVLEKYFGHKKKNEKLKDFMKLNLTGQLNTLRRRLERGERVNYQEIDTIMYQTMSGVRGRLLQPQYAELEEGHADVAKEVAALLYHSVGLEGQNRAQDLKRHVEARHVVEEMQQDLERDVAQAYRQFKQTSAAPEEKKGGKKKKK